MPQLHVYVALDPTAGDGGCQAFLLCPGSGSPENLPTSTAVTTSATPEVTAANDDVNDSDAEMTCNRNGGSAMSYEGTCDGKRASDHHTIKIVSCITVYYCSS